jgi:hypothetical protein
MVGVMDYLAKGYISDAKWGKILAPKKIFIVISMEDRFFVLRRAFDLILIKGRFLRSSIF